MMKENRTNIAHNTDGGSTTFYDIGNCKDVDDLTIHWNMNFFEGNCLKALVGIAKSKDGSIRHDGTNALRDAKKLVHYANKILKELKKNDS